jgi:peptidoglycan/xylan/chitin deacetylase (PgdA/CDA1 family)
MYIMRNRTLVVNIVTIVAVTALAGCGSPPSNVTASSQTAKPISGSASPSTAPVDAPVKPAGPPPAKGTTAWYVAQVPTFAAPPPATKITTLASGGPAQQFNSIPVGDQKVAFITIDDGWEKDQSTIALLRAAHIPFTMFLTTNAIKSDPAFFKTLEGFGGVIEDHTITHGKLTQMRYAQQVHEICGSRTTLAKLYGRAPIIMRAPYGLSNHHTLKAAASCGIRANVFWDEWAINGKVAWQRPGGIHPGDMVLMHFDKDFKVNFLSALAAFDKAGITPARLENYLVTKPSAPASASPSSSPAAAP